MVVGTRPEKSETVELTSEGGESLGGSVLTVVGTGTGAA